MTLNLVAYIVYIVITWIITVYVGLICYRNGIHFIYMELGDKALSESLNRILLTGYYLVNLGYASCMLYYWEQTTSIVQLISSLCQKTGMIVILLGTLHYLNMLAIYILRKKKTI